MKATKLVDSIDKKAFVWHEKSWKHEENFHLHHKAQLIYVEEGYQYLYTTESQYLLPQHHVAWIPSNIPHKTTSNSERISLRTLYFDTTDLPPFYNALQVFTVPPVLKEMILYTEKWSLNKLPNLQEQTFLQAILLELPSFSSNTLYLQTPIPTSTHLLEVTSYIHSNYQKNISIDALAYRISTSVRTLQRQFKKETGISIAKYIQMIKMIRSIELLTDKEFTIDQVATLVGYSSSASYSNSFTQLLGKRPTSFIK